MKEICIASRNAYKQRQFDFLLAPYGVKVLTLADMGVTGSVEETGMTARENACLKARFWANKTGMLTIADDAGLEIDALGGEPGVQVRRWNGIFPDTIDDETWLEYLMNRMKGIPQEKRTGRYRAAWVVCMTNETELVRDIVLEFLILEKPFRPYMSGSPMSSLRYFPEYKKVETQLSPEQQWATLQREMAAWREFLTLLDV